MTGKAKRKNHKERVVITHSSTALDHAMDCRFSTLLALARLYFLLTLPKEQNTRHSSGPRGIDHHFGATEGACSAAYRLPWVELPPTHAPLDIHIYNTFCGLTPCSSPLRPPSRPTVCCGVTPPPLRLPFPPLPSPATSYCGLIPPP